ncbi:DUF2190 family protein [bacterium]|nr:DUF2190 family protein [bacterium]
MSNSLLQKTFVASEAIAARRIVTLGANLSVSQASSGSAANFGVTELACEAGAHVDVMLDGIAEVEAGTNLSCGDFVAADSNGKAIPAGFDDVIVGRAMDSASAGEYVDVLLHASGRPLSIPSSQDYVLPAGAAVAPGRIVKFSTGKAVQASAGTDVLLGVAQDEAHEANDDIAIAVSGIVSVTAGAAVSAGAYVTADANGKAIAATAGTNYLGVALEAAAAADDRICVAIRFGAIAGA